MAKKKPTTAPTVLTFDAKHVIYLGGPKANLVAHHWSVTPTTNGLVCLNREVGGAPSTQYMGKDAADALGDALKASARTARDLNDLLSGK